MAVLSAGVARRSSVGSQPRRSSSSTKRQVGLVEPAGPPGDGLDDLADADHPGGDVRRRRGPATRRARPCPGRARRSRGRVTGRPRTSARSWHQYALRVAPPVSTRSPSTGRPAGRGSRSRAARRTRRPAARRVTVAVVGGRRRAANPSASGGDEREPLAGRDQRVGEGAVRRLVARGGLPVEVVEVARRGSRGRSRRRRCWSAPPGSHRRWAPCGSTPRRAGRGSAPRSRP